MLVQHLLCRVLHSSLCLDFLLFQPGLYSITVLFLEEWEVHLYVSMVEFHFIMEQVIVLTFSTLRGFIIVYVECFDITIYINLCLLTSD